MTRARIYDEIVNLLASGIVLGVWALLAWGCSWLFNATWDHMFLMIIAASLATSLGKKATT